MSTQASIAVTKVYFHPTQPERVRAALVIGVRLVAEHGQIVGDRTEQA